MKPIKRKMMYLLAPLVFLAIFSTLALGQTTGKIRGTVRDAETKEALPGANILIEGTNRGTAADAAGDFLLLSVPPGSYSLQVRMIGYATARVQDIKVSVNRTANVDVDLKQEALAGEEVVVTASQATIKKDQTSSIRNVSAQEIEILPVNDIAGVVRMQAGVVNGHFRGGRFNEVSYMIDGLQVDEAFDGNFRTVDLEPEAIQDLGVITGSFNAEYGRAMSGVVNAVTKDGGPTFHGTITAEAGEFFSGNDNIWIGLRDTDLMRNQDLKASLSGPVLGDRVTFFTNVRYQKYNNYLYGIRRFNVDDFSNFRGDDPNFWISEATGDSALVPMNGNENLSFLGKLSAKLRNNLRVSFLYAQ